MTPFSPVLTPNPRPGYTKTGAARVDLARGTLVPVNRSRTAHYEYDLVVHSTVTGERVGHVVSDAFPGTWLMSKDKLVFFVPERVVVEDLSRGKKLFERPLRALRYLGPYPPRAASPRP